jgi:hypothetical protein
MSEPDKPKLNEVLKPDEDEIARLEKARASMADSGLVRAIDARIAELRSGVVRRNRRSTDAA